MFGFYVRKYGLSTMNVVFEINVKVRLCCSVWISFRRERGGVESLRLAVVCVTNRKKICFEKLKNSPPEGFFAGFRFIFYVKRDYTSYTECAC